MPSWTLSYANLHTAKQVSKIQRCQLFQVRILNKTYQRGSVCHIQNVCKQNETRRCWVSLRLPRLSYARKSTIMSLKDKKTALHNFHPIPISSICNTSTTQIPRCLQIPQQTPQTPPQSENPTGADKDVHPVRPTSIPTTRTLKLRSADFLSSGSLGKR